MVAGYSQFLSQSRRDPVTSDIFRGVIVRFVVFWSQSRRTDPVTSDESRGLDNQIHWAKSQSRRTDPVTSDVEQLADIWKEWYNTSQSRRTDPVTSDHCSGGNSSGRYRRVAIPPY